MPVRGPKTELVLQRYSTTTDGGGGLTKSWTAKRRIRGTLTTAKDTLEVRIGKETLHVTHQFWCQYPKGLNITEKDEFSRIGSTYRYRICYVDNVLEQNNLLRIDLLLVK